jgi:PiT family inorganic phosphate transporter
LFPPDLAPGPWLLPFAAGSALALLSFANGANDNGKGVATLVGSGLVPIRRALLLALVATAAGGLAAILWGQGLARAFRGFGLVPSAVAGDPSFLACAAGGAALAVLLATRLALPVSTTHALLGGLIGAGLVFAQGDLALGVLGNRFVLPLLASPVVASVLVLAVLPIARRVDGISRGESAVGVAGSDPCVCVEPAVSLQGSGASAAAVAAASPPLSVARLRDCLRLFPEGRRFVLPVSAVRVVLAPALHFLAGGLLSFARGLNDAPKIAAIGVAAAGLSGRDSTLLVCAAMAIGGWLAARAVTRTMSERLTTISEGSGLAASLSSAALVLAASRYALPVSTTHVTCGAIFGTGLARREVRWKVIARIAGAWVFTLPAALVLSAALAFLFRVIREFRG